MSRPFNIKEVKQNDVVPTKSGKYTVKILCTDARGQYPIAGLVTGGEYINLLQSFKSSGENQWNDDDDDMDLVLPDYTESVDVYIHRNKLNKELQVFSYNAFSDSYEFIKKVTIKI